MIILEFKHIISLLFRKSTSPTPYMGNKDIERRIILLYNHVISLDLDPTLKFSLHPTLLFTLYIKIIIEKVFNLIGLNGHYARIYPHPVYYCYSTCNIHTVRVNVLHIVEKYISTKTLIF